MWSPQTRLRHIGGQGWTTMEGLRRTALIALIIALALYLLVILSFAAYTMFLVAKSLVESAASFGLVWTPARTPPKPTSGFEVAFRGLLPISHTSLSATTFQWVIEGTGRRVKGHL
jgi:hypothetical protein